MSINSGITTTEHGGLLRTSDTEVVEQFRAAMREHGLIVDDEIIADGRIHRYRAEGDRPGSRNAWAILHLDGRASGAFGSWRAGVSVKWSADSTTRRLTRDERRAHRERIEQQKRERETEEQARREAAATLAERIWNAAKPAAKPSDVTHPYLRAKGIGANGARVGDWPVIDPDTGEIRYTVRNALLLLVRDFDKRPHSVQAIIERTGEDGQREFTKLFLRDGAKRGHFFPIGQPRKGADGRHTFIVAEGFATAASVHEATGHGCVVAFDAGNLAPVCREIRARFPDARVLIVGDRDAEEHAQSTGSRKAADAALEVGACLFIPEWTGVGRDANDIFVHGFRHEWADGDGNRQTVDIPGPDHLQGCIELALAAGPLQSEGLKRMMEGLVREVAQHADGELAATVLETEDDGDPEDDTALGENPFANNRHFRVLGVDGDTYFFFRKGKRNQILPIRTSGLSKNALMSLAPLNWWEAIMLGTPSGKFDKDAAVGFLMEAAEAVGIFDPTFTRGRGAWWDEGRLVVHLGDRLLVDGTSMELDAIRSEFLYLGGRKIAAPSPTPLSDADGAWLLEMAKSFRWARPASAPLLCGWLLLSPLCGALNWRPHAWITGGAGSGKSTILDKFVRPLIPAGMDLFANGDSTEAGLRQTLHGDARPIMIDESESDTDAAATKMQRIITMIRQSSSDTGAQTYRGTVSGEAQSFQVRSMALLSSIGVALERQQDLERVSVLALRPKREGEATDVKNWPAIRAGLNKIAKDKTLSARLFRRSIDMAPVVMESIDVFTEAAATFFGTAREGDQIGALLAGAWCLVRERLPTPDEALAEIERYDWGDYQEGKAEEQDDLIATLMGRPITRQGGTRTSVGKLIARAAGYDVDELPIEPAVADSELHNFGMKVLGDRLLVHPRNPELLKLMRETKFASDLRGRLKRVEGADTAGGGGIRIGEANTNGLRIPLLALLSHRAGGEDEPETF
ncbi:toprim domain-containing protein [Burkholderia pseudomallei]|uniref:toprim domain-containing protein n=1 Tax=Burkholderia pseudomallei TaxID=28450 RepID=UPI0005310CD2|nr:toprim domain-containing protein [Burkholderia pseudomallei]KGS62998.1 toprim domain protein [Burkholderia pseudomallei MSHR4868]KGW22185.1 toprim domain protein [Burkholderia pseudomallei MSHR733]